MLALRHQFLLAVRQEAGQGEPLRSLQHHRGRLLRCSVPRRGGGGGRAVRCFRGGGRGLGAVCVRIVVG